jgi:hypothetical protein
MRNGPEAARPKRAGVTTPSSAKPTKRSAAERFPARELAKRGTGDALPAFVEPCLAILKPEVPVGDKWVHEVKWDGYRLMIRIENGAVRVSAFQKAKIAQPLKKPIDECRRWWAYAQEPDAPDLMVLAHETEVAFRPMERPSGDA